MNVFRLLCIVMLALCATVFGASGVPIVYTCHKWCDMFDGFLYFTDEIIMLAWKPAMKLMERPLVTLGCSVSDNSSSCRDKAEKYYDVVYHGGKDD